MKEKKEKIFKKTFSKYSWTSEFYYTIVITFKTTV